MSCRIYIIVIIVSFLSCKTNKAVVEDQIDVELVSAKSELESAAVEVPRPQSLKQLIKAMALDENAELSFREIFAVSSKKMTQLVAQKLSPIEENKQLSILRNERDSAVIGMLDSNQVKIYKQYLADARKKLILSNLNESQSKK